MCRPAAAWVVVDAARARIVKSRQDNRLAHWCDCGVYNRHAAVMLDRSFAGKGQASTPFNQLRPRTKILITMEDTRPRIFQVKGIINEDNGTIKQHAQTGFCIVEFYD